jgi:hypothetical protein
MGICNIHYCKVEKVHDVQIYVDYLNKILKKNLTDN